MKTLDEHNKVILEFYNFINQYPQPNGIACPECGNEMKDLDSMV